MSRIDRVIVAIPARNEATRIGDALGAVEVARRNCSAHVVVVVAADACTDTTAEVASTWGAMVISCDAGRVGAARAAAVECGLLGADELERVWIANTDADSAVPADWLAVHLDFAEQGVELLRGSVLPHPDELAGRHLRRWLALNPQTEPHQYVHGANLGLTGKAYRAAGGFSDVPLHEDAGLVRAVEAAGLVAASTVRAPVVTSARTIGRVQGGFATYLRSTVLAPSKT